MLTIFIIIVKKISNDHAYHALKLLKIYNPVRCSLGQSAVKLLFLIIADLCSVAALKELQVFQWANPLQGTRKRNGPLVRFPAPKGSKENLLSWDSIP